MISSVAPTRSSTFYAYLITKIGNRNLKGNVLRGRCQDADMAFEYRSKCILLLNSSGRPIVLQFRRLVDMNLEQHYVYLVKIMIENGICHQTLGRGVQKREKHKVLFSETLTYGLAHATCQDLLALNLLLALPQLDNTILSRVF